MKSIKLLIIAIAISGLAYSAVTPPNTLLKSEEVKSTLPPASQHLLLKKWRLSHYEVFGVDYKPEKVEKNDYMHFLENNTYTSVSEGKFEKGKYKLEGKTIILTNETEEGELKLIIKALTSSTLSVVVDDPADSDAKYLIIHFKGQ